jgi:hypothetical protein
MSHATEPIAEPSLYMSRLLLSMLRIGKEAYFGEGAQRDPTTVLIAVAVYVGQLERRPLSAFKIAQELQLPRSTVIRHLRKLQAEGLVLMEGKRAMLPPALILTPAMRGAIRQCMNLVQSCARLVAKADGSVMANDVNVC